MKFNQLRDFVAIAETGSLRAAARSLGLAQPAITRNLQELEQSLGAQLFVRGVRGVTLTPIGQTFLLRANTILGEIRRSQEEVSQLQGGVEGALVVGFSIAGHMGILGAVLPPFRRKYPKVRLRVIEGLLPTLEPDLSQGFIDIYVGPVQDSLQPADLHVVKLFDNDRVVIARKGHPLSNATTLAELQHADWMTTSITHDSGAELFAPFAERGLEVPRPVFQCQSALSILSVLLHSDMLAMVPRQWLQFEPLRGVVQPILLPEKFPAPPIMLVHRAGLILTPAAEHLVDLIGRHANAKVEKE